MSPTYDDDLIARLDSAPDAAYATAELFERARRTSEARAFLAIIDLERMFHEGKAYLVCEMIRHSVVQQFSEYLNKVISVPVGSFGDEDDANFVGSVRNFV